MEFYFVISNHTNDPMAKPATPYNSISEAVAAAKEYSIDLDVSGGYYIDIFSESPEERTAMIIGGGLSPTPMRAEFVTSNKTYDLTP